MKNNFTGAHYKELSGQGANTLSNILRVALIFLKGGIYLDLDNISIRPLPFHRFWTDYVFMEENHKLMLSFLKLRKGNRFLEVLMEEMVG